MKKTTTRRYFIRTSLKILFPSWLLLTPVLLCAQTDSPTLSTAQNKPGQQSITELTNKLNALTDTVNKETLNQRNKLIQQGFKIAPNNKALRYQQALLLIDQGAYIEAREITKQLISQDPNNGKYLKLNEKLGKLIQNENDTLDDLTRKLKKNPKDATTRLTLVNYYTAKSDYKKAYQLIKAGVAYDGRNPDLLYEKLSIEMDLPNYKNANKTFHELERIEPDFKNKEKFASIIKANYKPKTKKKSSAKHRTYYRQSKKAIVAKEEKKKNIIHIYASPAFASDREHTWYYNGLSYGRITDVGTYFIGMRQAVRNASLGVQGYVAGYTRFTKYFYTYTDYAYSSSPLYPKHFVTIQGNFVLPHQTEVAFGGQYYRFRNQSLWAFSPWISKHFGNHWIALKPKFFKPESSPTVIFPIVQYRYYFERPNHFIFLSADYGRTPDLLDITDSDFVIVNQWDIFLGYQFPVSKNAFLYVSAGYTNQKYPSGLRRKIPSALIGIKGYF